MDHIFRQFLYSLFVWIVAAWGVFISTVPTIILLLGLGVAIMQFYYWYKKNTVPEQMK